MPSSGRRFSFRERAGSAAGGACERQPIAAALLGAVKRLVGGINHCRAGAPLRVALGNADTDRHANLSVSLAATHSLRAFAIAMIVLLPVP